MFFNLFKAFFLIGAFTIGGGLAMIPIIEREIVKKQGWLDTDEFIDVLAIAQSSPGVLAANLSIYIGYKIKGFWGAVVCLMGVILPSFLSIILIAQFFFQFWNHPIVHQVFLGLRPAVAAILASAVYSLASKAQMTWVQYILFIGTSLLIVFVGLSPIYIILTAGLGAVLYHKIKSILKYKYTIEKKHLNK